MKISYISESTIPSRSANSIHVMKMCQAFARNGHQITLLTPNKLDREPRVKDPYDFYGVDHSFKIERLPWLSVKRWDYVYGLMAALKSRGLSPDLVYGRSLPGCFFSATIRLPVIYESHQPAGESGRIAGSMFSRLVRNKHLRRFVVISEGLRRHYQLRGVATLLLMVAQDGADDPGELDQIEITHKGSLQVGYVGHLYPGRGVETIFKLAKACSWADFHIIGGTDAHVDYWQQQLNGLANLRLYGFLPHSFTDRYRQSFDVLLAPYERRVSTPGMADSSPWMSPLKIFEYMAAGKPIICSDLPALREVLKPGKTALLCDPDDIGAWTTALTRLRDDLALRKHLGQAAKRELQAKYTWTARAEKVVLF